MKSLSRVQLFATMDCSPPGSSVHGIFQATVLEWIAISFSRGSSQPRDRTQVYRIVDRCFTIWATREVWLYRSQQTVEISSRYGNTRPPYQPPEKPVCWSRSNSWIFVWNNRLVQIEKEVQQSCILSPCLFNLYAEYIMRNAGLDELQAGIKIVGEISITSDMQMTPPLWQKVKRN